MLDMLLKFDYIGYKVSVFSSLRENIMSNQSILVADSDPKNLQILKENLEASGFQVITVADGSKAWDEIRRNTPKFVLTEINLPGLTGFQLLEKLQADPNTSFIPLIFLTNQREIKQRVRSFQLGAKDYLVKPLHVKEVIAHIRMVSRRLEQRRINRTNNYSKFSGQLNELKLADLIESFSVERKTGILTLNNGNNRTGQVYFRDGAVINANLGELHLENAIFQMLPWDKGFFSMVFKEVDVSDEISISNLGLLLEGVKRMEQREKLFRQFPSPKTAFTVTPTFKQMLEKRKLPEDVKKFVSLIDGKRNIKKIIDDSCYDDLKTLDRLLRLVQQGFINPTIAGKVKGRPEIQKQLQTERKIVKKPLEIEPPVKKEEKQKDILKVPDMPKPIKERIEKRRAEIILPREPDVEVKKGIDLPPQEEPKKEPEIAEKVKPPETEPVLPVEEGKVLEPTFNKDGFLKKENQLYVEREWEETTSIEEQSEEREIPKPRQFPQYPDKNHLLVIGMDEDSLDEVMDILTNNNFQTKKLDALDNFPVHFGKVADIEFDFLNLLGIFIDNSFDKIIGALSHKLIANIFVIDCTREDIWEYASYLINSITSSYHLPYVVAITNCHEENSITLDVVRYKLNFDEDVRIVAWDPVDKSSIQKLLASVVHSPENEKEETTALLEEYVERATVANG